MNFISPIFNIIINMRERMKMQQHERMYGPHFDETKAFKAVSKMENEDGTRGEHWSINDTTRLAGQYGINLSTPKFNRYDWYVALNMVYSDYYKIINTMANGDHTRFFVKLAEAWLCDRDIDEGKMWYYYCYIMCDKIRDELMEEGEEEEEFEEEFERFNRARGNRARGNRARGNRARSNRARRYADEYDDEEEFYFEDYRERMMPERYGRLSRY